MESNKIKKNNSGVSRRHGRFGWFELILVLATFGLISSLAIPALAHYIERRETLQVLQSVPRPAECQVGIDEQ
jgi:hypothetical protein